MKRRPLIITILFLIATIVFLSAFDVTPKTQSPYTADKPQTTKEKSETILDIQKQIEEEIRKEQEAKAEKERLARLSDPELISSNLRAVGKLTTFQGIETYQDTIIEKGFLKARGLDIEINYEFSLGIDLNKIYIEKIEGDEVTINIPKVAIQIQSLTRLNKDSYIHSTKTLFAKEYSPSLIDSIVEQSQDAVAEKINKTPEYFDKAYESLKDNLEGLILELGYTKVKFTEI